VKARENSRVPGILAVAVTLAVVAVSILPFFIEAPDKNNALLTQEHTNLWNGWLVLLGYFCRAAQENRANAKANPDANSS
jgi:branched-subunit amino acid transport protein AzlD